MDKSMSDFKEWFYEQTGWETLDYPNKELVRLTWQAWQEGRNQLLQDLSEQFK